MDNLTNLKSEAKSIKGKLDTLLSIPAGELSKAETQSAAEYMQQLKDIKQKIELYNDQEDIKSWLSEPSNPFSHTISKESTTIGEFEDGIFRANPRQMKAVTSTAYKQAFFKYVRGGQYASDMTQEEFKTLQEGTDHSGGFLVPWETHSELVSKRPAPTSIIDYVRTIDCSRDAISVPRVDYTTDNIYTNPMRLQFTGEIPASEATVTSTNFGATKIDVFTNMAVENVTRDMLEDSAFDIMGFVTARLYESARLQQENAIINGTGVEEPVGLLANPGGLVGNQAQPASASLGSMITGDKLIDMAYSIPAQYDNNSRWLFNKSNTGRGIAQLKDQNDRYLFGYGLGDSGLAGGRPSELLGYGFTYSSNIANAFSTNGASGNTAGTYPIVFGDFSGYYLARRGALSIQVLYEPKATLNQIQIVGRHRYGGACIEGWKLSVGKIV